MNLMDRKIAWILLLTIPLQAAEDERLLRAAAALEGGKISNSEKSLFRKTIRSAKESVARETLDVFYSDALDAYHRSRYDEALELLNNVYSVDPNYEDVATLRETIARI